MLAVKFLWVCSRGCDVVSGSGVGLFERRKWCLSKL